MRDFFSSSYSSHIRSPAGRILNKTVGALNEHNTLPKLITFMIDDDIVKDISDTSTLFAKIKGITHWLLKEVKKAIDTYKEYLPVKSKKDFIPHVLWMAPPMHKSFLNNKKREMFADCLLKEVKFHKGMTCLRMKKIWDPEDSNSFIADSNRFTSEGFAKYWLSIDSAIRYWNVAICLKINQNPRKRPNNLDRFHWKSSDSYRNHKRRF